MNLKPLRLALIAGFALPLGIATASFAQDAPPPPPAPHQPGEMRHEHHMDPAKMREHMASHLRTVLQLTPAQEPALNAFLDSMKPPEGMKHEGMGPGGKGHEDGDHDGMEHLTTPQRLDKMAARLDAQRAHIAAIRAFYGQLTEPQQKAFDEIAPMLMHHAGHGMGGGERRVMIMRGEGGNMMYRTEGGDHPMGPGGPPQD